MEKTDLDFQIPVELLGLEDIKIDHIYLADDGSIHIQVSSTKTEIPCRKCHGSTSPHGAGQKLVLRHLSLLGREVYIEIRPSRGICKSCDNHPTTTQTLSWFEDGGRHTKPYNDYLLLQLIGSTLVDVAKKEGITDDLLQGIVNRYAIDQVDWKSIKRIGLLGIDEIAMKKGYNDYITLITCRYNGKNHILGIVKGKEKTAIQVFLASIPHKKRKTITAVCVDMCDNYINAVKDALGTDIPIVVDRFHVAKLYRKSLTTLRSSELKRLKRELSEEEYKTLSPAIKILIKKSERYSMDDKKILEPLFKLSSAIKAAYKLARELTHIYNTHHRKSTAETKIKFWIQKVESSDVTCLNTFIKTLTKYEDHITNYFIHRDTSGWVEGINNKVKVIKRRCYGLSNLKHFFQRIFLDLSGYDIFLPKQSLRPI
jgi:transposase